MLASIAALVNAITSVLQRIGVESAPASSSLRLSLMAHAVRRRIWLVGFALMLMEFALQATALRFGQLSVVQPVLTTELLFLVVILGTWFRYHIGWREWVGAATVVAGLGGFFLAAAPSGGHAVPDRRQWTIASAIVIAAIVASIVAAQRGPRWWRAAAFGAATAVTVAYNASLTKATTTYVTEGWGHVFTHAQPYLLAATGLGTVFLLQNALHAGPITASRTTLVTINPLVSIVLGITLFGDRMRGGAGWTALELIALAALVAGVVALARSPLVAGAGDPGTPGEMLADARRKSMGTVGVATVGTGTASRTVAPVPPPLAPAVSPVATPSTPATDGRPHR